MVLQLNVTISVDDESLFKGLDKNIEVGRYHSWVVDPNLPDSLEATSFDENGQVMSLRHKIYDVKGVQYHPESVLTPDGKKILENWVNSVNYETDYLIDLINHESISSEEAKQVLVNISEGQYNQSQIASFLNSLYDAKYYTRRTTRL